MTDDARVFNLINDARNNIRRLRDAQRRGQHADAALQPACDLVSYRPDIDAACAERSVDSSPYLTFVNSVFAAIEDNRIDLTGFAAAEAVLQRLATAVNTQSKSGTESEQTTTGHWYTTQEAAQKLGVNVTTITRRLNGQIQPPLRGEKRGKSSVWMVDGDQIDSEAKGKRTADRDASPAVEAINQPSSKPHTLSRGWYCRRCDGEPTFAIAPPTCPDCKKPMVIDDR